MLNFFHYSLNLDKTDDDDIHVGMTAAESAAKYAQSHNNLMMKPAKSFSALTSADATSSPCSPSSLLLAESSGMFSKYILN